LVAGVELQRCVWWHLVFVDDLTDDISNQFAWRLNIAVAHTAWLGDGNASSWVFGKKARAEDYAVEASGGDPAIGIRLRFHVGVPRATVIFYFIGGSAHVGNHNQSRCLLPE